MDTLSLIQQIARLASAVLVLNVAVKTVFILSGTKERYDQAKEALQYIF